MRYSKGPPKLVEIQISYDDEPKWVPGITLPPTITMDRYFGLMSSTWRTNREKTLGLQARIAELDGSDPRNIGIEEYNRGPTPSVPAGPIKNREMIYKLRAEIDSIWRNENATVYELVAVIMRSGRDQTGMSAVYRRLARRFTEMCHRIISVCRHSFHDQSTSGS